MKTTFKYINNQITYQNKFLLLLYWAPVKVLINQSRTTICFSYTSWSMFYSKCEFHENTWGVIWSSWPVAIPIWPLLLVPPGITNPNAVLSNHFLQTDSKIEKLPNILRNIQHPGVTNSNKFSTTSTFFLTSISFIFSGKRDLGKSDFRIGAFNNFKEIFIIFCINFINLF